MLGMRFVSGILLLLLLLVKVVIPLSITSISITISKVLVLWYTAVFCFFDFEYPNLLLIF